MKKLFVISDVHGFYDEMKSALDKAGFDPTNENHWLISCGDTMDRGPQPAKVMNYLMKLPRKILIKGNHESLIQECCERGYPASHDYSNGTFETICELGSVGCMHDFDECFIIAEQRTKSFFDSMVNYFETENYIFVHAFIPLKCKDGLPVYLAKHSNLEFNPDWRYAHYSEWEEARWGNPYELAMNGFLPDKTLVFGHWHTSYPRHILNGEPEFEHGSDFSIYHGDGYIGIDACTAHTHQVNVLVIEDNFIDDNYPCTGHECYDKGNYHASCTTCPLHK